MTNTKLPDTTMSDHAIYAGTAALSICEALLLAMNDHKILPEKEILGVLQDAADAHDNAIGSDADIAMHKQIAALINHMISGGNSVRRP